MSSHRSPPESLSDAAASSLTAASTPTSTSSSYPSSPVSRIGRDHQRYGSDGARLVAGTVPFRSVKAGGAEVMLVSSTKTPASWILPKGGWEDDETEPQAAMRETYEEAGVVGCITLQLLSCELPGKSGKLTRHTYYGLCVDDVLTEWPESHRARRWVPIAEAAVLVKHPHHVQAIQALMKALEAD